MSSTRAILSPSSCDDIRLSHPFLRANDRAEHGQYIKMAISH